MRERLRKLGVQNFIFPHWVLGQCGEIKTERFCTSRAAVSASTDAAIINALKSQAMTTNVIAELRFWKAKRAVSRTSRTSRKN